MTTLLLPLLAVALGLAALVWSADRFVDGAAASARLLGVPALLVGMVVVGFGTSAPELTVSALSAWQGNPAIALGNAWGSNICNIALILGLTAAVAPVAVRREALLFDLPALVAVTAASWWLVRDGGVSRANAWILLGLFAAWLAGSCLVAMRTRPPAAAADAEAPGCGLSGRMAAFWTLAGLALLVLSSRALVWGAVELAQALGVSDLVIGLTVVAVGTSLPELASSVAAARKGEDDLAVGNIIGSNLFNTLAVVGVAGAIRAMPDCDPAIAGRDIPAAFALSAALLLLGLPRWRGRGARDGRLGRPVGWLLLAAYAAYLADLVLDAAR